MEGGRQCGVKSQGREGRKMCVWRLCVVEGCMLDEWVECVWKEGGRVGGKEGGGGPVEVTRSPTPTTNTTSSPSFSPLLSVTLIGGRRACPFIRWRLLARYVKAPLPPSSLPPSYLLTLPPSLPPSLLHIV